MRKLIALILVFMISFLNVSYAANWVTITAENGKQADLDLDSVKMALNTVEYDIKFEQNGNVFINRLSSELYKEDTPTAVIMRGEYKDGAWVNSENVTDKNWKPLKQGTLQAEIFDVLSKELEQKSFSKGQDAMDKYLKKQRKNILSRWNPKSKKFKYYDPSRIVMSSYSPMYYNTVRLDIDKNGIISDRESYDSANKLWDVRSLDELPNGYSDEVFKLNVDMKYYKYVGCSKENRKPIIKQSPVEATVTVAKNSRPPVLGHIQYGFLYCYKKTTKISEVLFENKNFPFLVDLIYFPIALVGSITVPLVGWAVFGILFPLSGGDFEDL